MAHNFCVEVVGLDPTHPIFEALGKKPILRACSAGCGAVFDLASASAVMIAHPSKPAPPACPRAPSSPEAKSAHQASETSAKAGVILTEEIVADALCSLRMPSAADIERERKHPLMALGDAELAASCEERRQDKYNVVNAWQATISLIQRRIAVMLAATWYQLGEILEGDKRGSVASPRKGSGAGKKAGAAFAIDLTAKANGHPLLRVAEADVVQRVTKYSLDELYESVLVDHLTAQGVQAWLTHLHWSGKRWSVSSTMAVRIEDGSPTRVPWFWHWSEARAREATAAQIQGAGAMRIRSVKELQGSLEFEPREAHFNWLSWLARLGLVVSGKHDAATAHLLALVWASVNRCYITAEKEIFKTFRYSAESAAKGASLATGPKRTGEALKTPRPNRIRCSKCSTWHAADGACPEKKTGAAEPTA